MAPPRVKQAIPLIDEVIDLSEAGARGFSQTAQRKVVQILDLLAAKSVEADKPNDIGDLVASISELIPIDTAEFLRMCEVLSSVCVDREYTNFTDEAIVTVVSKLLQHLREARGNPAQCLRALSVLLYNNTLRLQTLHEEIIDASRQLASVSPDAERRVICIYGNIAAFSKRRLPMSTYASILTQMMHSVHTTNMEVLRSLLRSFQLLIPDAPIEIVDVQFLSHLATDIIYAPKHINPTKFEALSMLKTLTETNSPELFSQWNLFLTNDPNLFSVTINAAPKLGKHAADVLTNIFRGKWKYLQIADNTSRTGLRSTLAHNLGNIIDSSFTSFLTTLHEVTNPLIFDKLAKAFATFVRNCSFDSGRLSVGYIERVLRWCKENIEAHTEQALIVMKSLLWNKAEYLVDLPFMFNSFVRYFMSHDELIRKPAGFALCRMAYAYGFILLENWDTLSALFRQTGPVRSLPVIVRLLENPNVSLAIWTEVLQIHIPAAFAANHFKSIERSLEIIGMVTRVYDELSTNLQRFCLSTALSSDVPSAYAAVGSLVMHDTVASSGVFLHDALDKLMHAHSLDQCALSNVLQAYAKHHPEDLDAALVSRVINAVQREETPYTPRCLCYLLSSSVSADQITALIASFATSISPKVRWNTANAIRVAFTYGYFDPALLSAITSLFLEDSISKVKINSVHALLVVPSKKEFGDHYHSIFEGTIRFLLQPNQFSNMAPGMHIKYNRIFHELLIELFMRLLSFSSARDFSPLSTILISSFDDLYDILLPIATPPQWQAITTLYEAKFDSIPSSKLELLQQRAFPTE